MTALPMYTLFKPAIYVLSAKAFLMRLKAIMGLGHFIMPRDRRRRPLALSFLFMSLRPAPVYALPSNLSASRAGKEACSSSAVLYRLPILLMQPSHLSTSELML